MKKKSYILLFLFLTINFIMYGEGQENKEKYIFHPKALKSFNMHLLLGFSIARLPAVVVEEEISFSPMVFAYYRLGLPLNLSLNIQLNSNYISNHLLGGLKWTFYDTDLSLSFGTNYSVWYGKLKTEGINLETWGTMLSPNVAIGIDFKKFLLSAEVETQYCWFQTYSDDENLGTIKKPAAGYAIKISLEQPLWDNNWLTLALKLNYARFYYQSWLTYTTINEYLLYPELIFGFVL